MTLAALARWLNERQQNCARIAATKTGDDAKGWLEDMAYFTSAIKAVDYLSDQGMVDVPYHEDDYNPRWEGRSDV